MAGMKWLKIGLHWNKEIGMEYLKNWANEVFWGIEIGVWIWDLRYIQAFLIILLEHWVDWPGLLAGYRVSGLQIAGIIRWFWAALDHPY